MQLLQQLLVVTTWSGNVNTYLVCKLTLYLASCAGAGRRDMGLHRLGGHTGPEGGDWFACVQAAGMRHPVRVPAAARDQRACTAVRRLRQRPERAGAPQPCCFLASSPEAEVSAALLGRRGVSSRGASVELCVYAAFAGQCRCQCWASLLAGASMVRGIGDDG